MYLRIYTMVLSMVADERVIYVEQIPKDPDISELSLSDQVTEVNYVRDNCLLKGQNVKIGKIELFVPEYHTDLPSSVYRQQGDPSDPDGHATRVARVMVGQSHGIAPSASLYCRKYTGENDYYLVVERLRTT